MSKNKKITSFHEHWEKWENPSFIYSLVGYWRFIIFVF